MARLTAAARRALPDSAFAGPNRSYPVEDANHRKAAKSMAARYASPAVRAKVDDAADRKLGIKEHTPRDLKRDAKAGVPEKKKTTRAKKPMRGK